MMNQVYVYKYVKANPLIKLNVNDKVYMVNGIAFLSNQYGVTRKDCLKNINFEDLVKIGLFEKTITNFNISNYSKGDLVVLSNNKDKARKYQLAIQQRIVLLKLLKSQLWLFHEKDMVGVH